MPLFQKIWNPFSHYADRFEKKAERFLRKITFQNQFEVQQNLLKLMQENLVSLNLWLEKEFKGYKYLKKSNRKRMYAHTQEIIQQFEAFEQNTQLDQGKFSNILKGFQLEFTQEQFERLMYLAKIMAFLKPGQYYTYLEGASFGKLLVDISKEKMIGDCNQIVTFYTFLYSLHFKVDDLKIKILPGHVCLHFQGIDIEATNGTFQKYDKYDYLLPITELISTNLLDISDFRDKQIQVEKRVMLRGANLAFKISSLREIVEKNLQITYQNLIIEAAKENDFDTAKFFLDKMAELNVQHRIVNLQELRKNIFGNAVIYYSNEHSFTKGKFYLDKLKGVDYSRGEELQKYLFDQEGFYYFKSGSFEQALSIFKQNGNEQMVKACYAEKYNQLQKKVAVVKTQADAKNYRNDYRKMLELAHLMGDSKLVENLNKVLSSL